MKKDLLHTPEGVRDIYGAECRFKSHVTDLLKDVCERYGYSQIQTPTFEFFDVFSSERGSVPSNEMFKFFDHHGNTLVLRPDMTPPVARTAAKYFGESKLPVKVYYKAESFINHENAYRGQLKENTIVGAELIGANDPDEDFEIICMAVESMKAVGLKSFQVEIGNIRFFKGLLKEAGIGEDDEEQLVSLINKKNFLGVEELLDELAPGSSALRPLKALPELFGTRDVLDRAAAMTDNEDSRLAIERLCEIYEKLKTFGYEEYVSFDLGSLSNHLYYTGIIFNAFTFGTGEAVLSGGRYDKLIAQFGVDRPAIGFSVVADRLTEAMKRQNISFEYDNSSVLLIYDADALGKARELAFRLRSEGQRVGMIKKASDLNNIYYSDYAKEWSFSKVIMLSGDKTSLLINEDGTAEPIVTKNL